MNNRDIDLHVPTLTRVEGEGAMHVVVEDGVLADVRLEIYEPPRFFEAFLVGRRFDEPIDLTARICGICPVAYQMSAVHAIEQALGLEIDPVVRQLRRLLYCGEWIESHVLHIAFLHAPDFLGYPSGIDIARDHPDRVAALLGLKKLGNDLIAELGGRAIHPVNIAVGGFHRRPDLVALRSFLPLLEEAEATATELVHWVAGFDPPVLHTDAELVALHHPDEYPFNEGRVVSSAGLDIDPSRFEEEIVEFQVPHSTALHAARPGGGEVLVGPLARWALNHEQLPSEVIDLARSVGIGPEERNPFRSIVVRALEVLYAVGEARRIIAALDAAGAAVPAAPVVEPRAGTGWAVTEAPRGALYHRYRLDESGAVVEAQIVPPTAQNQPAIEADLRRYVGANLALDDDRLRHTCEQIIRNHDPCISCATHFLDLTVERR